jgi:hypothetical protein
MISKQSYLEKILVSPKRNKIDFTAIKLYLAFVDFCKDKKLKGFLITRYVIEDICSCSGAVARNKLKVLEQSGLILIRSIGIEYANKWVYEIEMLNKNQRIAFLKRKNKNIFVEIEDIFYIDEAIK